MNKEKRKPSVLELFSRNKWALIIILLIMIAEPSLNSFLNFWLKKLFDAATVGSSLFGLLKILTLGFLFWVLKRFIIYSNSILKSWVVCKTKYLFRHSIFRNALLGSSFKRINKMGSGTYIAALTNDITILEQRYLNSVLGIIGNVLSIVIVSAAFVTLNFRLGVMITVFGIISSVVPIAFSKSLNKKSLAYSDSISALAQDIKEYINGYNTIKNYSIESRVLNSFNGTNKNAEQSKFEADAILSLANNCGSLISWFMQFIAIGVGLAMVIKGDILIGTVVASQGFASDLAMPLQDIIANINSVRSARVIVDKLNSLAGEANESPRISDKTDDVVPVDLSLDNVTLKIDDLYLIKSFSFTFQRGKKYLIVGKNGAGKSLLFRSVKKQHELSSGEIRLGDVNVKDLDSNSLSRYISYINENVSVFSGSIVDNILLFNDSEPSSIEAVAQRTYLSNLDLQREIGEDGRNISSGEQRKIEIARSLVRNIPILILDEMFSTLDVETAYELEKMVLSFEDKTVISISHTFSGLLVDQYDEILIMEDGQLMAHGQYDALIESCEYFRRICEIKFGRKEGK